MSATVLGLALLGSTLLGSTSQGSVSTHSPLHSVSDISCNGGEMQRNGLKTHLP
jgi:hypothetical protein